MESRVNAKNGRISLLSGAMACLLLAIAGNGTCLAQAQKQDFSKIEVKVTPIAGKVYLLQGSGGNIAASVGEDGTLIVDDEFEPLAPKIRAALASVGGGDKVKMVVNTHWHGDHTGSNKIFGAEAPIIAQTNVRRRLSTEQTVFGEKIPASPKVALPVVTFDQSVSVHWNGEEIKVVHFPHGHTDGDSVVFFTGSNVVHMGDDFFAGSFPFVDLGSGGSVSGLAANVAKVLTMIPADAKVIPGHGPLSTRADLERFHDMLVQTSDIVHRRMMAGESLEKMQAEGFPESFKPWGAGFVDNKLWIQTVRDSLVIDSKKEKEPGHPSVGNR
jgi:glyoxylase-like metal-dependent hydrolase (beta-lactamase superfamily II)